MMDLDRQASAFSTLLERAILNCQIKMDNEGWEITDFFPAQTRERVLIGRQVYELTGTITVEELTEEEDGE